MENPIPGAIVQVKTMARSVRITFDSQEVLTPAQMAELFALYERVGWFFFLDGNRPLDVDLLSLPDLKPEEGQKSRAVRLRNTLYRVWEREHKGNPKSLYSEDSDAHYNHVLDRLIDKYKERLA